MKIQIQKLSLTDSDKFKDLINLFESVFEMTNSFMPPLKHLTQLLTKEDFFVFVALSDDKVVGGLTAYSLQQYYSVLPLVFIYDVAVQVDVQRQGVGRQLITALKRFCKERGYEEMFVLADEVDTNAIEFYRSTNAAEGRVINFEYRLK